MEKGSKNRRKPEIEDISLYATLQEPVQVFLTELISSSLTNLQSWVPGSLEAQEKGNLRVCIIWGTNCCLPTTLCIHTN